MDGGGGLISPYFSNCTIAGNLAGTDGGGFNIYSGGEPVLENTILWGNCAGSSGDEINMVTGVTITARCCDIDADGISGTGSIVWETENIFSHPLFCDPEDCQSAPTTAGGYELCESSPCVDAPECGQIGALGIGCSGPSATRATSWGGLKALFRE